MEVLCDIPINLELGQLLKRMRLRENSPYIEKIARELLEITRPIARPKAVYEVCYVENKAKDSLDIGGVRFTSKLLRDNLDKVGRVFPYIATCGRELDEIAIPTGDFMPGYCLDFIKATTLRSAISYLEKANEESLAPLFHVQFFLAKAYLESERLGEAVHVLESMLSRYDEYRAFYSIWAVKSHYLLGLAYEKSGWDK